MKHSTRLAGIAGASAIALSLLATPALADELSTDPGTSATSGSTAETAPVDSGSTATGSTGTNTTGTGTTTDTSATGTTDTTGSSATDSTGTTDSSATDSTGTTDPSATDSTGTTDTTATGTTDTTATGTTGADGTVAGDGTTQAGTGTSLDGTDQVPATGIEVPLSPCIPVLPSAGATPFGPDPLSFFLFMQSLQLASCSAPVVPTAGAVQTIGDDSQGPGSGLFEQAAQEAAQDGSAGTDDAAATDAATATDDSTADDSTGDDSAADSSSAEDSSAGGSSADGAHATSAPLVKSLPTVHRGKIQLADSSMTLGQYRKGIVAHLVGFKPGEKVAIGWGSADLQRGDLITTKKVSAKGTLDLHFTPSTDNAKLASYTLSVFSATSAYSGPLAQVDYTVKESSTIAWRSPTAVQGHLRLSAEVSKIAASSGRQVPLRSAVVKFQEKVGSVWKTRKTVKADASGLAVASVAKNKHQWRAVLLPTRTVRGTSTRTHTL